MRRTAMAWLAAAACTFFAAAHPAAAQKPATVLELYTSQGCSSCPPADKLLSAYAKRRDIVALSFNVDYWDYLGWKDTLASPIHSKRQRTYARHRGDGEVYTPQMVVNGMAHAIGSMPDQIDRAIATTRKSSAAISVPISVRHEAGKLRVEVGKATSFRPAKEATIWLATVRRKVTVPVRHGENRGRTLTYYNVVSRLTPVGMWAGKPTVIELRDEDVLQGKADTCAILVQMGKGGPIIAASWMDE